jgi:hypothetical protein
MTSSILGALAAACLILTAQTASAGEAPACPVSDKEFLRQITANNDWQSVHAVYRRNLPACSDEGLYADGYTSMVVDTLARRWSDLGVLSHLLADDAGFAKFFYAHIGAAAAEDDLKRALAQSQHACPKESEELCGEIGRRLRAALDAKH